MMLFSRVHVYTPPHVGAEPPLGGLWYVFAYGNPQLYLLYYGVSLFFSVLKI